MNKQSKSRMPERINVGVWIHIRHWEQSLCENGIFQSCLHLVTVLMRSPREVALRGDGRLNRTSLFCV